ncbi:hypothetical protein [Flavobacterium sp. NRK F7]|uniref:hypothetical protein n=1 Tax=Flavobacterium sp. NRK F7 TaxID=2954930 RepID=UPI002090E388|nr:hypothetical protein [Flavobacterium sp. NRK F7]MCO6162096.1 hypothetical protein [Flavobacterium sp. NRK F7]
MSLTVGICLVALVNFKNTVGVYSLALVNFKNTAGVYLLALVYLKNTAGVCFLALVNNVTYCSSLTVVPLLHEIEDSE